MSALLPSEGNKCSATEDGVTKVAGRDTVFRGYSTWQSVSQCAVEALQLTLEIDGGIMHSLKMQGEIEGSKRARACPSPMNLAVSRMRFH